MFQFLLLFYFYKQAFQNSRKGWHKIRVHREYCCIHTVRGMYKRCKKGTGGKCVCANKGKHGHRKWSAKFGKKLQTALHAAVQSFPVRYVPGHPRQNTSDASAETVLLNGKALPDDVRATITHRLEQHIVPYFKHLTGDHSHCGDDAPCNKPGWSDSSTLTCEKDKKVCMDQLTQTIAQLAGDKEKGGAFIQGYGRVDTNSAEGLGGRAAADFRSKTVTYTAARTRMLELLSVCHTNENAYFNAFPSTDLKRVWMYKARIYEHVATRWGIPYRLLCPEAMEYSMVARAIRRARIKAKHNLYMRSTREQRNRRRRMAAFLAWQNSSKTKVSRSKAGASGVYKSGIDRGASQKERDPMTLYGLSKAVVSKNRCSICRVPGHTRSKCPMNSLF